MSVNLEKEKVNLGEVFSMQYTSINAESDVIVPDVKPDIAKVLQISGDACITQQNVQQDKVYIQGTVKLNVLYIPDSDLLSGVRSMTTVQDFSHLISVPGARPEMKLFSEAEIENISYSLINSRKINIRSRIGLSIKLCEPMEIEIPVGVVCDTPVQTKKCKMKIMPYSEDIERDVVIRQQLEVPSGKSDIAEVLKLCAKPQNMRLEIRDGEMHALGELDISTLYCGPEENVPVMFMQHSLPIDEAMSLENPESYIECEGEFKVCETYCEIQPDSDGDERILGVEVVLKVCIKTSKMLEVDVVDDAYSLGTEMEILRKSHKIEQLVDRLHCEETAKISAEIPDYLPEVAQICDCSFSVNVSNVNIEDGKAIVYGTYVIKMLYISENDDAPVSGFEHTSDFEHIFDSTSADLECACDAQAEPQYIGYTISSSRNVEFRLKSGIMVKLFKAGDVELIEEINMVENNGECEKCPNIIIYFVQSGDTLWNIAKRYKTTVEKIMKDNGLDCDKLSIGQQLKIIRNA